ncbi:MAG: transglutaminase-like domain-containing protein [Candidatus Bathyarchaeia archaeon]
MIPTIIVALSVPEYQSAAQKAASQEDVTYFKGILSRSYNYTELILWENQHITYSENTNMQRNTDPIKILEYGKGACMEFAILYAALCISQGYRCRIVEFPLNDHATNEVWNGSRWISVDASANPQGYVNNPLIYEREGQPPRMLALAFEGSSIVEVTGTYRSDHWNVLSAPTLVIAVVTVWCFFCFCFVWSNKQTLLMKARRIGKLERF